jgi:hypothetical protein
MIIKRWNGSAFVEQYPKTTLGSIYDDDTTTSFLNGGKIRDTYLPNSVFSGMKNVGTISGAIYLYDLIAGAANVSTSLDDITSLNSGQDDYDAVWDKYLGHYWIATAASTLAEGQAGQEGLGFFDDGIEKDGNDYLYIEKGDWVLISGYDAANNAFKFNIINNTYANASQTQKGVVELATDAEVDTGTSTTLVPSIKQLKDKYALKSHLHTDSQVNVASALSNIGSGVDDPLSDVLGSINTILGTQATNISTNASDIDTLEGRIQVFSQDGTPTTTQTGAIWFDI